MEKDENNKLTLMRKFNDNKKQYIIIFVIVVLIVFLDQVSKILVMNAGEIQVIDNVLKFVVTENKSGAYGIGSDSTIMYIITNLVVIAVIYKFITSQNEFIDTKTRIFASFIMAGGISNVIDRIARGFVIEFIDFNQVLSFPVLNIADIFVFVGWIGFVAIFAHFTVKEMKNKDIKKDKIRFEDKNKKDGEK